MVGLRYRGGSSALPSVSRFRSGHMPIGMTVGRVTDNLSESDMDTCSDSEGECYGARYSLEASPQDDKIPNGNAKHSTLLSARNGNASGFGNYLDRQGGRGGGYAAAHRGFVNDESSDSVSSSEVSSTPPRSNNVNVLQKKIKLGPNFSAINVQSSTETLKQLGVLLNSMKRMLDTLRPQIEAQLKLWGSCIPESGNMVPGECLSEVTVMIRSKFRAYVQAVIDKLVENTKLHNATKLKKIIQDAKENVVESDLRRRMQPLKELLAGTIDQLHAVLETQVFVIVCRGFWDRMGQDMLKFLEDRKENRSWYKASRVAVTVLDDTFASQMQQLLGNALQEKDVEPPRCILEVRSMLCKDGMNHKENNYYY
ncbi:UNVERIFIED_CONTAM: hypothetical protein Sindi_2517500 [Sesamum indicum]